MSQRWTGTGRNVVLWMCGALLVTHSLNCSFDKPSAPSWDVEVTVPLINKTYTMSEIATDEDVISADSSGLLRFDESVAIDRYFVDDQLSFAAKNEVFNQNIGSISIESPGAEQTGVQLREIFTQADALDGQSTTVAPFSFATSQKPLQAYGSFSYAIVESGLVRMIVENNMPIPIGSPITIELWDTATNQLISSTTTNQQVAPGTTSSFTIDLAGKRIPNLLSVRMLADSPGSGGSPVLIDASSSFVMTAEIGDLTVSEALAEIPSQEVSEQDVVSISDSLVVHEAQIESGQIQLLVTGNIAVDSWVVYELPDFLTPSGTTYVDSFFVGRNTSPNLSIDLGGLTLRPQIADFSQQIIRFNWTVKTVDTGANKALVRSSDAMNASVNITKLVFSRVTGKLGNQTVDISQDNIDIDIPADVDSVFFATATMELIINNGINFPAEIHLVIEGENDKGAHAFLNVNDVLQPATAPGEPVTTTIVLDHTNSNIEEFISIIPSVIRVTGNVRLSNSQWVGTVTKSDFVDGDVEIKAPIVVKLPSQTVETDVQVLNIDEDVRKDIIDNLSNGSFFVELTNHLPVGATIEFLFCEKDSVYQRPRLLVGPIGAEAALVDGSGYVVTPQDSQIDLELTEEEMRTFLFDPLYSGVRLRLYGTDGKYVRVRNSDYLKMKSYAKIKVNVN